MARSSQGFHAVSLAVCGVLALWAPSVGLKPQPDLVERTAEALRQQDQAQFERQVDMNQLVEAATEKLRQKQELRPPLLRPEDPSAAEAEELQERIEEDLRLQLQSFFSKRQTPTPSDRPNALKGPSVSIEQEGAAAQLHLRIHLSGPRGPLPVDLILLPSAETGSWMATEPKEVSVGIKKSGTF